MALDKKVTKKANELKKLASILKEKKRKVNLKMSVLNTKRVDLKMLLSQVKEDYIGFKNKANILLYIVTAIASVYFIIGLIVASKGMLMLGLSVCAFGAFLILTFYIYIHSYIKLLDKKIKTVSEKLDEYIDSSLEIDREEKNGRRTNR
ncbi:MAG: hypothetical protein JSW73_03680 [Candidatus Woesearchaeota archaeon]|nr:MAG: hypothetical protein JSW73_03680 [Candidatus Woesearchaeota archaeon]